MEVNNRFETLYNSSNSISTNTAYTYFETACKEPAAKIIPLKQNMKNAYCEKQMIYVKKASYYINPLNLNTLNHRSTTLCISTRHKKY